MKITSIYGKILWEDDRTTLKESLEAAVTANAILNGAILNGARLLRANLVGASLVGTILSHAILDGASLDGANLDGANLDGTSLDGASLIGTSLIGTSLVGASLIGAMLNASKLDGCPIIPHIDARILAEINKGGVLDMHNWHRCGTTHCRAGWAIMLAGEEGSTLEERLGPSVAGALIYAASRPGMPVPNFYASNDSAMADLQRCAALDPIPKKPMRKSYDRKTN